MSSPPLINARVYVSWDGSGDFDGEYDDVTPDTAGDPGIVVTQGRDSSQTLSPPQVAAGELELFNHTGRYSQHREDSPIYQRVLPGRRVRYQALVVDPDLVYDGPETYDGMDAYDGFLDLDLGGQIVDEISQTTAWGQQRVRLTTIGIEVVLTDSIVTVPLQTAIRTDEAAELLLDACGWPALDREISVGDTTLLYWWCDERHPWDALIELLGAEGPGTFYVRNGIFHWENRNYRAVASRSLTSQATYQDVSTPSNLYFTALGYEPGYINIYNRATYATRRRSPGAAGTKVWEYGTTLTLSANQERTLFARPTDPFQSAISPVVTTDYTLTSGAATITLTHASGLVAFIAVVAGPAGCVIDGPAASPTTGLQLRATPLPVVSETVVQNSIDTSDSIATFSPIPGENIAIPLSVTGWPELEPASAEAVCNAWVNRYQEARPTLTVTLTGGDAAHLFEIATRQVSDRVTLVDMNTGLDDDAWVNALELRISGAGGRRVEMVLGCELCDILTGAIWDVSIWDDPAAVWGI